MTTLERAIKAESSLAFANSENTRLNKELEDKKAAAPTGDQAQLQERVTNLEKDILNERTALATEKEAHKATLAKVTTLETQVTELEKNKTTAGKQAVKIAAGQATVPVSDEVEGTTAKASWETYKALPTIAEKRAYYEANREALNAKK